MQLRYVAGEKDHSLFPARPPVNSTTHSSVILA